jgi:hypothetical protein
MPASDRLSASQEQLLTSVQQLQNAQRENMNEYANAQDPNERNKIMAKINKNEVLRTNLLASANNVNLVQAHATDATRTEAESIAFIVKFTEIELANARERLDAAQIANAGKKRMIEMNTYYGKRFMAQAGVMKIFIYMCIPVLILAVLANAGLLPNYIAGFIIIAIIVTGIIYIYAAVDDINRRDKMNFDEYTWEFDPSRVGTIVNPNYGTDGKGSNGNVNLNVVGCFNGNCCGPNTQWDSTTRACVPKPNTPILTLTSTAQGGVAANNVHRSQPAPLLGNLNAPN